LATAAPPTACAAWPAQGAFADTDRAAAPVGAWALGGKLLLMNGPHSGLAAKEPASGDLHEGWVRDINHARIGLHSGLVEERLAPARVPDGLEVALARTKERVRGER